ncbi:50S ribosomal protein L35 [Candidatus Roizmanbacteria bacterium CG_4_10_14_0_8_um_filter_39_9]|uniref:Large ribosomal subunit protein bL35 n=1 Tax=Candidatus Roizmanbacteria bacterium CG_4_10_14_0_8_um_filter_39_9 TaxID=1974829 RepID=A0A2M7QC73_9BACT|nr:MAG: 50S ribosomal protein L35 [Candidatus Roizmanbacteria bacterium CG_4_10_14_0_8_um_filter_39_9]
MKVKQRTHKGASKRFRVTKNGKVMHRSQKLRHLRHVKGKRNTRRLKLMKVITGKFAKKLKKILGIK